MSEVSDGQSVIGLGNSIAIGIAAIAAGISAFYI
jgi:hypothetical protein